MRGVLRGPLSRWERVRVRAHRRWSGWTIGTSRGRVALNPGSSPKERGEVSAVPSPAGAPTERASPASFAGRREELSLSDIVDLEKVLVNIRHEPAAVGVPREPHAEERNQRHDRPRPELTPGRGRLELGDLHRQDNQ